MSETIAQGSLRIIQEHLLASPALAIPRATADRLSRVKFKFDQEPFFPTPFRLSESLTAIYTLAALFGATLSSSRYGVEADEIEIDINQATLTILSLVLVKVNGTPVMHPDIISRVAHLDKGKMLEPYRAWATNVYKTKDGRWFQLHGGLNATHTLNMLGQPAHRPDLSKPAVKDLYTSLLRERDSRWLDIEANEHWRQAGTICYTQEEFLLTPHGQAVKDEPLYSIDKSSPSIPAAPWPPGRDARLRPLAGIKVVDVSRVVAAPTISKMLSLFGADVIRVSSSSLPEAAVILFDTNLGKRDADIDLKTVEGKKALRDLLEDADVVIDGFRTGSLARLGFSAAMLEEIARRRGKGIVYCQENCYGWKGEWAHRSGWQQVSDCLTGVSWAQGHFLGLDEPVVPPVPNTDYGAGIAAATATLHALLRCSTEGGSYTVRTSLTQYNMWYTSLGQHSPQTQQAIRARHPNLDIRHYTTLVPATEASVKTLREMAEREGDASLWSPDRWSEHENRWGVEGERGEYLDWRRIITYRVEGGGEGIELGYDRGSCAPGSDEARW